MLKIQKTQFTSLEQASRADFEDRMIDHIQKFFPDHYAALKEEQTRQLIQFAIERAEVHKIVNERDVCKFTDLMVAFGPAFEEDPKHPWAAKILGNKSHSSPTEKVNRLYDEGLRHLESQG